MNDILQTFEVRVETWESGSRYYRSDIAAWVYRAVTKMFHVDAKTGRQAMRKCEKHGRPISARKIDIGELCTGIENLPLLQEQVGAPFADALAMDGMIWRKKEKRAKRMENQEKDREIG